MVCLASKKYGKVVDATGASVLRMIINAIPSNAYQMLVAGDITAFPYHGQWSGIQLLDDPERMMVWSELDMTAAFYFFKMEAA